MMDSSDAKCAGLRRQALKVAHVVPHLDNEAAGPTQSVLRLCESLALEGVRIDLHTMAAGRQPVGVNLIAHPQWRLLGRFGFSFDIVRALADAGRSADIVHNHSLWSGSNMAAGLTTRQGRALLVTSPRGTLSPEARARSALKKWLFKPLQWPAVTRAVLLHATSRMEYEDIRRIRIRQPVAIIPNGIDVPERIESKAGEAERTCSRLLFLGRLHPIKGIELLLDAWRELQHRHPRWELVVAGGGENSYVQGLHTMARRLGLARVSFPGPVFGPNKEHLYRASDLFVLPTKTENFGMAVAEALAQGLPVVTTRRAPWPGLVDNRCGWWIERTPRDLVEALDKAMSLEAGELEQMGLRGRQWMIAEYDWRAIARNMKSVYEWLCRGGEAPNCVMVE